MLSRNASLSIQSSASPRSSTRDTHAVASVLSLFATEPSTWHEGMVRRRCLFGGRDDPHGRRDNAAGHRCKERFISRSTGPFPDQQGVRGGGNLSRFVHRGQIAIRCCISILESSCPIAHGVAVQVGMIDRKQRSDHWHKTPLIITRELTTLKLECGPNSRTSARAAWSEAYSAGRCWRSACQNSDW